MQSNLTKISRFTGVDLSEYALDQPFNSEGPTSKDGEIRRTIQNMKTVTDAEVLPPLEESAKTYNWPHPIGTPEVVVYVLQEWMEKTDCDGFHLVCGYFLRD